MHQSHASALLLKNALRRERAEALTRRPAHADATAREQAACENRTTGLTGRVLETLFGETR